MVFVPAGEFLTGSTNNDSVSDSDEKPQHTISLDAFWIDEHEVTNAQYSQCVSAGSCQPPSSTSSDTRSDYYGNSKFDNYPVIHVSWDDAKNYCGWAGKRQPTEAEWEKAARGPLTGSGDARIYPWGSEFDPSRLNFGSQQRDTMPVGSYPNGASPYGALDMAGNVWEWVADWYDGNYYSTSPRANPTGATSGSYRVLRGGAWDDFRNNLRAAFRYEVTPGSRLFTIGFRCSQ